MVRLFILTVRSTQGWEKPIYFTGGIGFKVFKRFLGWFLGVLFEYQDCESVSDSDPAYIMAAS